MCYRVLLLSLLECEGEAFGYVCLPEHVTQTTIAPIVLICLHKKSYTYDSVLTYDDPGQDPDSRIY